MLDICYDIARLVVSSYIASYILGRLEKRSEVMARTQISTSCSEETRRQVDVLTKQGGYTLRDIVTLGIDHLYNDFRQVHNPVPRFALYEPDLGEKLANVLLDRGDEAQVIVSLGDEENREGPSFAEFIMLDEKQLAFRFVWTGDNGNMASSTDWFLEPKERLDVAIRDTRTYKVERVGWDHIQKVAEEESR